MNRLTPKNRPPSFRKIRRKRKRQESEAQQHPLVQLQQKIGNRAAGQVIRSSVKARRATQRINPGPAPLQRQPEEEEKQATAQLKPQPGAVPAVTPAVQAGIHSLQSSGGQPLSPSSRAYFEPRIGADFSRVRIHSDAHAAATARSLNARAFTVGRDVAFGAGEYAPGTSSGKKLLAHELTHVAQQRERVAPKMIQREGAPDRFERLHPDRNPREILEQINPVTRRVARACRQNCPATAAALHHYLRTGQITRAHCDPLREGSPGFGYQISGSSRHFRSWRNRRGAAWPYVRQQTQRHGRFVVVEGDRGDAQQGLTRYHYFLIVNIRGTRFVVDAYLREVTEDIPGYLRRLGTLEYAVYAGDFGARATGP
ncbi:MAG: DUF4157 domain-containing protein [Calditrichaeota bacterium]|nr:DUF4157 domain-containing protein [Calditrichota bacterium]MCB0294124.1 DUF4157 domain-containing protein [Calditrichota bacterium]MCB0302430.1 DUF4157 domain-containing protein [Calditrichota bacterium]MCB0312290.1 DUF4157 domain-containing protein [Calditrichota bacterium]MCB9088594.1 DUF4157 domain-containing protein [Calditrichia bacterium]